MAEVTCRICFDAVASERAKELNCCGFETCGDCATLWFEHERACPGCRAEASLRENVKDYSRGLRTETPIDVEVEANAGQTRVGAADERGVRVLSPSSPPPETTMLVPERTLKNETPPEHTSGSDGTETRAKKEGGESDTDADADAESARVVFSLPVVGERLSRAFDVLSRAFDVAAQTHSRELTICPYVESHSGDSPLNVEIDRVESKSGDRDADPAADVAAALRAAAAAVERAVALVARETERAPKPPPPPPTSGNLSSEASSDPEASNARHEERETTAPSETSAGNQTRPMEERIEALERELAAMRAAQTSAKGEDASENSAKAFSGDMHTKQKSANSRREPLSLAFHSQRPGVRRTPTSASFHTHLQPVHGIAACALPDAFLEFGNGEQNCGSFAVATASWDGDAQVHVFLDERETLLENDLDDEENSSHRRHRRVDLIDTYKLRGHNAGLYACAFSSLKTPAFLGTASGDGSVRLWDMRVGLYSSTKSALKKNANTRNAFPCVACLRGNDGEVNGVAFDTEKVFDEDDDGLSTPKTLAASTDAGAIIFWDVASQTRVASAVGHDDAAYGACFFGPESNALVASVSFDKTCKVWDRRSNANDLKRSEGRGLSGSSVQCVATMTGHADDVVGVDFCPSTNLLATGSDDGTVRLWDARLWRCLEVLEAPHAGAQVKRVRFSPDGTGLVTAGGDGLAKTFAMTARTPEKNTGDGFETRRGDGEATTTMCGHADAVFDAAWVPGSNRGGRLIVTAGHDAAWRVWDAEEGGYP